MLLGGRGQAITAVDPALDQLAWRWAAAVRDASFVALSGDELRGLLRDQIRRLAEARRAEPFTDEPGHAIGAALVEAHISAPEALRRSIALLARVPVALDLDPVTAAERTGPLLGAV